MIVRIAIVAMIVILLAVLTLAAGEAYKFDYKNELTTDKDFLQKQKKVYEVFYHFSQPQLNVKYFKQGYDYDVEANVDNYTNKTAVKQFLRLMKHGFLPQDTVFSIYYPNVLKETLAIYRILYYAKDFDTFFDTSLYLRNKLNAGTFAYAFYLAVIHRPDTQYIRLPPIYELAPHYFYNVEFMEKTHNYKLFGKHLSKHYGDADGYVIPYNYSNHYLSDEYDYEQRLNYFTEDIGLNNYYWFMRNNWPFFLSGEELGTSKSYRGEEYLYLHQLLFNRYFLERLSNDLGHVEDYDYDSTFYAGYWPTMSYPNGMHFPSRPWESYFPKSKFHDIHQVQEFESRIKQAIDSGIAFTKEGKTTKMYSPEGLSILGNMIEGNEDSVNKNYYGHVDSVTRNILGFNLSPLTPEKLHPSALEHDFTALRDPAFWRIAKRLLHFYKMYKYNQQPYKPEEIEYPELKIHNVEVSTLETYFEEFETWMSYNLDVENFEEAAKYNVWARQKRLNHKHFSVNVEVEAPKATKAAVRIFIGPKYNVHMKEIDFKDHNDEFVELDNFIYDLSAGVNKIVRNCDDFFFVVDDPASSYELYNNVTKSLEEGAANWKYEKRILGFPLRLILPKGKPEGMPYQMFVHVAPVEGEPVAYSSRIFGDALMDNRPLGYPLDRPIDTWGFKGANFYFKDIFIYHKKDNDMYVR